MLSPNQMIPAPACRYIAAALAIATVWVGLVLAMAASLGSDSLVLAALCATALILYLCDRRLWALAVAAAAAAAAYEWLSLTYPVCI